MKNIRLILAIITTAAAIVSCSKDNVSQEIEKPSEKEQPSEEKQPSEPGVLTAIVENTKTYLVPDSAEETSYNVVWNNKDRISTLQGSDQGIYITNCEDGSSSAKFTHESGAPVSPGTFDAYYPSETVQNGTLVWPERQKYREYAGGPMVSAGNNADADGNAMLKFKHLGGVIRFKLNTTEEFKVKSAMMTATEPLSGTFTVNEGKAKINASSGIVVLDFDNSVTVDDTNTGVFCFSVPEGKYSNLAFYFLGEDGRMIIAKKTSGTLDITRGVVTRISATGVTPALSTEQGSNCFIFYNGDAPININLMGEYHSGTWIPLALGGAASAEVVWESDCTDSAKTDDHNIISSATYSGGKIEVTPTGTAGNAVIAIKNHKGRIIWSYHIWVPSTQIGDDITYNSHKFMDRDLGAKVKADPNNASNGTDKLAGGTLYQNGRKDPLPGFYCVNWGSYSLWYIYKPADTATKEFKSVFSLNLTDEPSVENTIQNVFVVFNKTCSELSWMRNNGKKSVSDPCPNGYRVPEKNEIGQWPAGTVRNNVWSCTLNTPYSFGIKLYNNDFWTGSGTNNYIPFWSADGNVQAGNSQGIRPNWLNTTANVLGAAIRCIKETASN